MDIAIGFVQLSTSAEVGLPPELLLHERTAGFLLLEALCLGLLRAEHNCQRTKSIPLL